MILFLLLLILAAVGLAIYATQNTAMHPVTFWNWHWAGVADWVPVIVAAAVIGVLFLLYMIYSGAVHGVRIGSMRRRVSTREQAINDMRAENQRLREENARLRARPTEQRVPVAAAGPANGDGNPNVTRNVNGDAVTDRNVDTAARPVDRTGAVPAYNARPTFGERVRAFFSGRQSAGY
jgi:uncharacterized integral membrane protein